MFGFPETHNIDALGYCWSCRYSHAPILPIPEPLAETRPARCATTLDSEDREWLADLLRLASDRESGVVDVSSSGGYFGDAATEVFERLGRLASLISNATDITVR